MSDKISPNFTKQDFASKGGGEYIPISKALLARLEALIILLKKTRKDVTITSGYRTPEYNAKVGGVSDSQHLYGKAVDIKIAGVDPYTVAMMGRKVGFTGIGVYNTFTHLDVREGAFTAWGIGAEELKKGMEYAGLYNNGSAVDAGENITEITKDFLGVNDMFENLKGKLIFFSVLLLAGGALLFIVLDATKPEELIKIGGSN